MRYAPIVQLSGTKSTVPAGRAGIFHTVAIMRSLVNQYRTNPDIRQAAVSCVFLMPEKNQFAEANAIFSFVRDSVRYVRDIHAVETISTPDKTLLTCIGDCDDQSTLLAAMCEAVGYPSRFVVAGYSDGENLEHVYVQILCGDMWVDCDPTEQRSFGWAPPGAQVVYVEGIG